MEIALAQINTAVGDVSGNAIKMIDAIDRSPEGSLVVFPEMTTTGYPLEDLVFSKDLQRASADALLTISAHLRKSGSSSKALIGFLNASEGREQPYNSVALVAADGVEAVGSKMSLPTYGVFDEKRLFTPGEAILTGGHSGELFAAIVCEDAWIEDSPALDSVRAANVDHLIVINGSPFTDDKRHKRLEIVERALKVADVENVIYLNLIGGQDDLVFDGGSFVANRSAGRVLQLPFFEEALEVFDTSKADEYEALGECGDETREEILYNAAVLGLRDYLSKNGFRSVLVGVSGGIDSALVTAMAADAIGGDNVYGVSMPSRYSSRGSLLDARELMESIGGHYRVCSIVPMFDAYQGSLALEGLAEENLQARLRGTLLMGISNSENRLVLTPGNKSELAVGYSTLYGDTVGGYAPLKDLFKSDVYALARWRNTQGLVIPVSSIEKEPSAELKPGQVDQDSLPPYEILDKLLSMKIEHRASRDELVSRFGEAVVDDVLKKIKRAEWKRRQYPIGPKLRSLSFGRERVVPITTGSD